MTYDVGEDDEGHHYVAASRESKIYDLTGRDKSENVDRDYREKVHVEHLGEKYHEEREKGNALEAAKTAAEYTIAAIDLNAKRTARGAIKSGGMVVYDVFTHITNEKQQIQ